MRSEYEEYEAREKAEEAAARAAVNAERKCLLILLRQIGETKVTLDFNGEGDEGLYDNLVLETGEASDELCERVASFLENVLCAYHPGHDNEDGAFGTLTWYIEADRLVVDFNVRLQASRLFKYEVGDENTVLIERGEPLVEGD